VFSFSIKDWVFLFKLGFVYFFIYNGYTLSGTRKF
jgi:hypothetical protein